LIIAQCLCVQLLQLEIARRLRLRLADCLSLLCVDVAV
jgi:hypothetical protein